MIHYHYDKLRPYEREFVDRAIRAIFDLRKEGEVCGESVPLLAGDDRCEGLADAMAKWIIDSRGNGDNKEVRDWRVAQAKGDDGGDVASDQRMSDGGYDFGDRYNGLEQD